MNSLTITGNLTRDPETRTTQSGKTVCDFIVAVNRRGNQEGADYFRVSAWEKMGENCQRFLAKGRKVAVTGPVSANAYMTQDGKARASLEVTARDVEFLSPKSEGGEAQTPETDNGYMEVTDEDLPF